MRGAQHGVEYKKSAKGDSNVKMGVPAVIFQRRAQEIGCGFCGSVETEIESAKGIIDKNIEHSFKY